VHALKCLVSDLAVDAGSVDYYLASGERFGEGVYVLNIDARSARDHHGVGWVESSCQMTAYKSGSACDRDAHRLVLTWLLMGDEISIALFSNMFNNYFEQVQKNDAKDSQCSWIAQPDPDKVRPATGFRRQA
jgi:hypothetical protein